MSSPYPGAPGRQREIYLTGIGGQKPLVPVAFDALEAAARRHMSKEAFAYIAGSAGQELTAQRNTQAFAQWRIVPRMLRNVEQRDTSTSLLGMQLPSPFILSPIGVLEMAHKQADIGVAAAAASLGVPMTFSNQASVPMEQVAAQMGNSPRLFQLYWSKNDALVVSLLQRAEAAGCKAIVITLDTTILGWRTRDLDLAYLPFLRGLGIAQYTSDPVFNELLEQPETEGPAPKQRITLRTVKYLLGLMRRYPGGTLSNLKTKRPLKAVRTFINIYSRPSITWADLPFIRQHTQLPILLKGILHPDDAQKAIDHGMDGIVVSNHGGRQVDGSISAIEALPGIVDQVQGQVPIVIDSGIRTGADAFKALALGATAVGLGRPYCYGLAIGGSAGVAAVLKNFMADFELTMGLAGCKAVNEINREMLATIPGSQ